MAYTPTLWAKGDVVTSEKLNKIEQGIVGKVDKVDGKTLSTNDYTDQDKAKLDGLESQIDHLESLVGSPLVASTVAEMTDEDKVYVYTGSETGYQSGNWYYYNGTTWTSGGVYNSVAFETDDTLSIQGKAADAKKTGDELLDLKEGLSAMSTATSSDVGKALKVKTVTDGKVTEWEFDEVGGSSADILVHGKNLFNGVWTEGYFVNNANGQLAEGTSYKVTGFIPIEPSTAYTISSYNGLSYNINGLRYAVYDENKDFISGAASTPTFTSESNAKYVRFSLLKALINAQLEQGTNTSYEPYEEYLDPVLVWSPTIEENVEQKIASTPLSVTPRDTTFFVPSPNLFDPSTAVDGELVVQTTGAFSPTSGQTRSGYIPIEGGKPYSFVPSTGNSNVYLRYALYKADKSFIRGAYALLSELDHVDTPTDAAYIAVSVTTATMPFMVAQADTIPSYNPYEYTYINPEYIVSEQADDIIINIPRKIYATEDIELNLYFEDLTEDWERYTWNIDCPVGRQMARGYNLTPTSAQAGIYALSITAKTKDGVTKRVNTSLVVTAKTAGDGKSTSILILGDSTTANGIAVSKINENFTGDGMTVSTLGTLGTAPNNHEGRSGWTFAQYFNTASGNAFYNPTSKTFDASYYFTNTGVTKPDWFIINLGINDTFNYTSDSDLETAIATITGLCNSMIASVKSASPNSKIGICLTIPPNHSQDAFGKAYACNQSRDRYKRNNAIWVQRQIEEYDSRESEGIYVIPIHTNLDTINNMGMETLPVNARNTSVTYQSPIGNGGVHPVESGYWQIADVYTAFLKGNA